MDNLELQEELFAQLRALSCAFSFTLENGKTFLVVEYSKGKKSDQLINITDNFYNRIVAIVKSYYTNAQVLKSSEYNTKFLLN